MRKVMIAAALVSGAFSTPALARDNLGYVALDAGLLDPQSLNLRFTNGSVSIADGERLKHKLGYDVDAVLGYDFGMFRLEGEWGYKHAGFKSASQDPAAVLTVSGSPVPTKYEATGSDRVLSSMLNILLDFGVGDGFSGSIGVGAGRARERVSAGLVPADYLSIRGEDSSWAWQALAEARMAVSSNVDLGLKFRHFETEKMDFGPFCVTTCGATPSFRLHGKYKSNSVLASLVYNFAGAAAPPPPPPPPPSPPPLPATQTCPDGSVIPATNTCPPPPAPPPPPLPPPEQRGERGQ